MKWLWTDPLEGTTLFPHHRRWDCRVALIEALRYLNDLSTPSSRETVVYYLGRAQAFNAIMFDCHDPLASAYARRIEKIRQRYRDLTAHERLYEGP